MPGWGSAQASLPLNREQELLAPGWPARHLVSEGLHRIPTHHRLSLLILPPQPRQRSGRQRGCLGSLPRGWDMALGGPGGCDRLPPSHQPPWLRGTRWTFWGHPGSKSSSTGSWEGWVSHPRLPTSPLSLSPVLAGPVGIWGGQEEGGGVCCALAGEGSVLLCTPAAGGDAGRERGQSPCAPLGPAARSGEGTPVSPEFEGQGDLPGAKPGLSVSGCPCVTPHPWARLGGRGETGRARCSPRLSFSPRCLPRRVRRGRIPSGSDAAWAERKAGFGLQPLLLPPPPPPPLCWEQG